MHDVTRSAAEDCMKAILAADREALCAARFVTGEAVAVVPAPGPLAHVAGERADVADLWRGDAAGGLAQHGMLLSDLWMMTERIKGHQPADGQAVAIGGDTVEALR